MIMINGELSLMCDLSVIGGAGKYYMRKIQILLFVIMLTAPSAGVFAGDVDDPIAEIKTAKGLIKDGDHDAAYNILRQYMAWTGKIGEQARRAALRKKAFRSKLFEYLDNDVRSAENSDDIYRLERNVLVITDKKRGISEEQAHILQKAVGLRVRELWQQGKITYTLADDTSKYPGFEQKEARDRLFWDSLNHLEETGNYALYSLISRILNFIKSADERDHFLEGFKPHLEHIKFSRAQLKGIVRELYPRYSLEQLANRTIYFDSSVEPRDVFLEHDFEQTLELHSSVFELGIPDDNTSSGVAINKMSIHINKLTFEVREIPERTETVRYADHEVNPFAAVLLMPRNASYFYEILTGGVEIMYALEVSITFNGRELRPLLLRDRLKETYQICTDARIQNVYGGTQGADFMANKDMQKRCGGSSERVNREDVEIAVYRKVAEEIYSLPDVQKIVEQESP